MQHVNLKIFDRTECENIWGRYGELLPGQFCVGGEEGRDSCGGDSGSALMTTQQRKGDVWRSWKIVGIVSFGPNVCGLHEVPGVYTKVRHYVDWILDNVKV